MHTDAQEGDFSSELQIPKPKWHNESERGSHSSRSGTWAQQSNTPNAARRDAEIYLLVLSKGICLHWVAGQAQ